MKLVWDDFMSDEMRQDLHPDSLWRALDLLAPWAPLDWLQGGSEKAPAYALPLARQLLSASVAASVNPNAKVTGPRSRC